MKSLMSIENMPQIECPRERTDKGNRKPQLRKKKPKTNKRIFRYEQYTIDGEFIKVWESSSEIEEYGK